MLFVNQNDYSDIPYPTDIDHRSICISVWMAVRARSTSSSMGSPWSP